MTNSALVYEPKCGGRGRGGGSCGVSALRMESKLGDLTPYLFNDGPDPISNPD